VRFSIFFGVIKEIHNLVIRNDSSGKNKKPAKFRSQALFIEKCKSYDVKQHNCFIYFKNYFLEIIFSSVILFFIVEIISSIILLVLPGFKVDVMPDHSNLSSASEYTFVST